MTKTAAAQEEDTKNFEEPNMNIHELVKQIVSLIGKEELINNTNSKEGYIGLIDHCKNDLLKQFSSIDENYEGKELLESTLTLINSSESDITAGLRSNFEKIERLKTIKEKLNHTYLANFNKTQLNELKTDMDKLNNSKVTSSYNKYNMNYLALQRKLRAPYGSLCTAYIRIYDPNYKANNTLNFDELIALVKEERPLPEGVDMEKINKVRKELLETLTKAKDELQADRYDQLTLVIGKPFELNQQAEKILKLHPQREYIENKELEESRELWTKSLWKYVPYLLIPASDPYKKELTRINKEIDYALCGGQLRKDIREGIIDACYGQGKDAAFQLTNRLLADYKAEGLDYYSKSGNNWLEHKSPIGWNNLSQEDNSSYKDQLASIPVKVDSNAAQTDHQKTQSETLNIASATQTPKTNMKNRRHFNSEHRTPSMF